MAKKINNLLGFYNDEGEKVDNINKSTFVQLQLLGSHAKEENAIVLVSTCSLPFILNFRWYLGKDGYPVAYQSVDKKIKLGRGMKMHKMLFGNVGKGKVVDHINRNKLDNRLFNLRVCTFKQNSYNTTKRKNKKGSKYKGVKKSTNGKWTASISKDGKKFEIKDIKSEKEAGIIYDMMAEDLFGRFAGKNFGNS